MLTVGNQPHQHRFTLVILWVERASEIGMVVSCPLRPAVAVWLKMSKRKCIRDMDDYADLVVDEAKEQDWVSRHAYLRLYSRNATMFRNLQSRLSPDEWLHGCSTGVRPVHGSAIPLREYGSARSCNGTPKKQLKIHDFCQATAVAVDTPRSCGG